MNNWWMHNPASVLKNETHKLCWDFKIQTDHQISARQPDLVITNKKERICKIVDFAVQVEHRVKLKESKKEISIWTCLGNWKKKLWNRKMTIIPIVMTAFSTVIKGLVQVLEDLEIAGRVETVQNTILLRSDRILRRVQETWGELLSLKLQWKSVS